ncbi:5-formyltetrahydrofolate cyclo-ligase [Fructobacillus fructosus]|uniref:5-formyltetrahydrofolate cyclo-ligase n=1 Tax=Fructobacillus fructosus TaxID=1631 RepID=UPI002D8F0B75|nr:5-formyltetrahydrofolate cyclo-ligase (FAU1) [Fructobacillus fructosus]CAK1228034.1 5-formyltetrahydrofolate cyclo-ligase (FAU1) [Fructobacillus fructosus]CAK1228145.1 5-formyltetrahydrofolate cyclo-ligase (FAU1) [Fructobacillus fructosus]
MFESKGLARQHQQNRLKKLIADHPDKKAAKEKQLHQKLFASSFWQQANHVALTHARAFEVATEPIIQRAWQEGKFVYLAKVEANRALSFRLVTEKTPLVQSGKLGLWEPTSEVTIAKDSLDLVIVPALAFDFVSHHRLGFGGGYYDCFLFDYEGASVGLVLEEQSGLTWPVDQHDQAVQYLIQ